LLNWQIKNQRFSAADPLVFFIDKRTKNSYIFLQATYNDKKSKVITCFLYKNKGNIKLTSQPVWDV